MEFFSYSKYPHLTDVFDQDYCNDGSHVKGEVFACHFPAKGVLVEERSSRAAVVHDNGDSEFRHSYRLRKWNERACKAITKAKKEREKVSYMYDLSMGWMDRHKLAYPNQYIIERRRRELEASKLAMDLAFPSSQVETIAESLIFPSSKPPCTSNLTLSVTSPTTQHGDEDNDWELIDPVSIEDDYELVGEKTVV